MRDALRRLLSRAHPILFVLVAGTAGFCTYFAVYAFRKPFTAATFEGVPGWSFALDYKIALVAAQVAGYALSKFIGVKVVSEIRPERRAGAIVALVGASWLALIAFALIPPPWNVVTLFLNGLPLGMIWGLVYGFMEGRRVSELLAAMLCASFVVASGVEKSIGVWLMQAWHVDRFWMPAATGALFLPLLLVSVWVLNALPPPDHGDEAVRVKRIPMDGAQRRAFLKDYAPGLVAIVLSYVLLTAFRDYRDNFAAELWAALGFGGEARIFAVSELPVAAVALVVMGAVISVRDNRRALLVIHFIVAGGCGLVGLSTLAFQAHLISPLAWMILIGCGLYMAYNPINAVLFDRLIAVSGRMGTAGFLIYVADSVGYLGSVGVLLSRNFGGRALDWLHFFILGAYVTSAVGVVGVLFAAFCFLRQSPAESAAARSYA